MVVEARICIVLFGTMFLAASLMLTAKILSAFLFRNRVEDERRGL
jgi:hypothetical protein